MSTFQEISVAITRRGELGGLVVEFTGVDGSRKANGTLKDSKGGHIGDFYFSPSSKSLNFNRENIEEIDSVSLWELVAQVDSFVKATTAPGDGEAQAKKATK